MEINVEGKNKKYAQNLKQICSSDFGDLSSFLLYRYENYIFSETDTYFSNNMSKFASDSLVHLEILGRLIVMLGGIPDYEGFSINDIFYIDDKEKLLEINIRLTKEKIILYTKNLNQIEDEYIKQILTNFIVEERKNLEILELLQLKYKKDKNRQH